jgi:hypothetical protein
LEGIIRVSFVFHPWLKSLFGRENTMPVEHEIKAKSDKLDTPGQDSFFGFCKQSQSRDSAIEHMKSFAGWADAFRSGHGPQDTVSAASRKKS